MSWSVGAGLEGRGVIVTGAAGGIGSATARAFAACGAKVLAVDIDEESLKNVIESMEGQGHKAIRADLRDLSSHRNIVQEALSSFGNLYVLAHLAAVLRRRTSINDVTEDDWDFQLDVNLKASFFLCREVANALIAQGQGGRIILFSSQGWWTGGFGGSIVYSASKGGIVSLSRGLARTLGQYGITVNTIAPGQVRTEMLLKDLSPEVYEKMTKDTPLGFVAEPEDIAGVVVFLASQHARYISGATINVSGGFLMY